MYNFFSDNLKMKAFKKALKEVEAEGFYANLNVEEETVPILPDMSKAVAELTERDEQKQTTVPETVNLEELKAELESKRKSLKELTERSGQKESTTETERLSGKNLYESLFKDSSTLLSDEDVSTPEFLDGSVKQPVITPIEEEPTDELSSLEDMRRKAFANLADRARARREEREAATKLEFLSDFNQETEIPEIEPDIEMPVMQAEPEPEEPNKVVVEVVADITKPQPPVTKTKTITKTVYVTKEVPVEAPAKPKVKRKPATNKKKKRKYDADISGGFNF